MDNDYQKLFIALSFGHHLVFGALTHVFVAVAAAVASARSICCVNHLILATSLPPPPFLSLPPSYRSRWMRTMEGRVGEGRKNEMFRHGEESW